MSDDLTARSAVAWRAERDRANPRLRRSSRRTRLSGDLAIGPALLGPAGEAARPVHDPGLGVTRLLRPLDRRRGGRVARPLLAQR
jgi:hypothetical protein